MPGFSVWPFDDESSSAKAFTDGGPIWITSMAAATTLNCLPADGLNIS
jgi:hypothetical protein